MADDETSVVGDRVTSRDLAAPWTWVCGSCGAFGEVDDDQAAAFAVLDEHIERRHTVSSD
jgi:hypothetical protein